MTNNSVTDSKSVNGAEEKKLFIETYGCQMNTADSEVVASIMQMGGYSLCDSVDQADAVFVNTCSIRDNAEQKIFSRLQFFNALRKKNKHLIVGVLGCMAERLKDELLTHHQVDLVAGPDAYLDLPHLMGQVEKGEKAINVTLSTDETYREIIPSRIGGNRISGFISIMRGCNNFCSYCIVPYTRGRERSRDPESILNELKDLQARGFKEVTLLGQNVNSFSFADAAGNRTDFPALLEKVALAARRHAGTLYHLAPERHERRDAPHHRPVSEPLPPHPPAGTIGQFPHPETDEPQIYPGVVPGPGGRHTTHHSRLRTDHRPVLRIPLGNGRGF